MWHRSEHCLLGLAGTLPRGPEATAALKGLLRKGIDWSYTLWAAERLHALPLLGAALERAGAARPPEVDSRCRRARGQSALRALVTERIIGEVKASFGCEGVPFMVLKGLPLAAELYGDTTLRPCADVDILVPRQCRDGAIESLSRLGFHLPVRSLSLGFYRRHHFHTAMVRRQGRDLPIELHWDVQPFFSRSHIPEAQFWSECRCGKVGSVEVTVPEREVTYLYLIQHLARHLLDSGKGIHSDPIALLLEPGRRGHITWLTDLVLLAGNAPRLDWARVGRLARSWGLREELKVGLGLARSLDPPRLMAEAYGTGVTLSKIGRGRSRRVAGVLPRLARPSERLHLRPILALDLLRYAFPGSAAIRSRYGLVGASGRAVLWRRALHACRVAARAAWLGADSLRESIWRDVRRTPAQIPGNHRGNARSSKKSDRKDNLLVSGSYHTHLLYTSANLERELSGGPRPRGGEGREGGSLGETSAQAPSDAPTLINGPSSR